MKMTQRQKDRIEADRQRLGIGWLGTTEGRHVAFLNRLGDRKVHRYSDGGGTDFNRAFRRRRNKLVRIARKNNWNRRNK